MKNICVLRYDLSNISEMGQGGRHLEVIKYVLDNTISYQ